MKKLLLISMILCITVFGFSQKRAMISKELRDYAVKRVSPVNHSSDFIRTPVIPSYKMSWPPEEEVIGGTRYDLQTNTSIQNRFFVYDDGTMGATWTMGFGDPSFPDRGTGYNYYDGAAWGAIPTEIIESLRTGWPSYAPFGENGELVVSHDFAAGDLLILTRDEKGTGVWTEDMFDGPDNHEISWNRTTTSGIDHSVIQMLSITWPTPNGGTPYEGLDGAILYSRSEDGGQSWDPENIVPDEMSSSYYAGFTADDYEWAASDDDLVAFLVGDTWFDLFLMKSADGGDTWEKTIIWEHPYPFWSGTVTDTFYCADGAHHLAFDSQGMAHVVFGINRAYSDGTSSYWFPFVDGVAYWNESMPTFSNNLNALNPYGHPDSELIDDYNLIGWTQDVNGDGEITFVGTGTENIGIYYLGLSSQPQIIIDDNDLIFVVYSSVTETYDNGMQNYRHLWERTSWDIGAWGDFSDLTSNLIHIYDECVFPTCAPVSDDYIYLIYQTDDEPGLAVRGDLDPYGDNNINLMKVIKNDIMPGINENEQTIYDYDVSQNYPNPFSETSVVNVNVRKSCGLSLEITNLTGQKVQGIKTLEAKPGMNKLTINAGKLSSGVYFYTVKAGENSVTKKMIVE
ncbi:MAG: T9SS type A sorting domain-containing protein [Bacteroidetes bacterium]|nr:T9SS type A sorting domain-containing protein [Bacteroidota bacterium]MBL7105852.1 T9SS type A sorting domain-containing protein [Bacteroidales bacterium]